MSEVIFEWLLPIGLLVLAWWDWQPIGRDPPQRDLAPDEEWWPEYDDY